MRILLTNDDGPFGPGLCPLRRQLQELGDVTVVCPASERSGVSHSITYLVPVRTEAVRLPDGGRATILTGSPTDCVKFALLEAMPEPPDLVVSGVNLGLNMGVDVFYSGTVAAALEAAFYRVPAAAFSTSRKNGNRMDAVAGQAVRVLNLLTSRCDSLRAPLCVNIPELTAGEPKIRVTRQSPAFPPGRFTPSNGPRGRRHYFLDSTTGAQEPPPDSDVAAVRDGAIAVTPLLINLTDEAARARLEGLLESNFAPVTDQKGG